MRNVLIGALLVMVTIVFAGCGYMAAAGAGAAGGYIARDKGYKVQSPVTKDEEKKKSE